MIFHIRDSCPTFVPKISVGGTGLKFALTLTVRSVNRSNTHEIITENPAFSKKYQNGYKDKKRVTKLHSIVVLFKVERVVRNGRIHMQSTKFEENRSEKIFDDLKEKLGPSSSSIKPQHPTDHRDNFAANSTHQITFVMHDEESKSGVAKMFENGSCKQVLLSSR